MILFASILLYVSSLFPDSICIDDRCDSWPGYAILLMGWMALLGSPANMTWGANLALFICWALLANSRWIAALVAGVLALTWGASLLLYSGVMSSESGGLSSITGTAIGYWLWLFSMVAACCCAGYSIRMCATTGDTPR